tara:strand:+ start:1 stop:2319 length:2319 start_codon:yes stop_codon:yes gene_type:complete
MAKILSNAGIVTGLPVEAEHVSQSVNALTAAEAYDIIISGSLTVNNLKYPIVDGAAGQSLLTDGAGNITIQPLETVNTASYVTSSNVYGPFGADSIQTASYAPSSSLADFAKVASSSFFALESQNAQTATSASYALTASYLEGERSASYVSSSITGNIITFTKSDGLQVTNEIVSSSYALTASYAISASHEILQRVTSSYAETSSYAITASHALNVDPNTYISSSTAGNAIIFSKPGGFTDIVFIQSSSYAITSSIATSSSYAVTASYIKGPIATASYAERAELTRQVSFPAYNDDSVPIIAGTPVYVKEVDNGIYMIRIADASDPDKMPSAGVAATTTSPGEVTELTVIGEVKNLNTFGTNVGKNIYVQTGSGGFTQAQPISPAVIQPIGIISEEDFTTGRILINGPMAEMSGGSAISASYALTASYAITSSHEVVHEESSSYAETSSYAITASYALNGSGNSVTASYALTASFIDKNSLISSGSVVTGSTIIESTITGSTIIESTITGSTIIDTVISSSTLVDVIGSGSFSGSFVGDGSQLTNVTASIAATASYISSSNVDGPYGFDSIITASYAVTASYLTGLVQSSSFALTASYVKMSDAYREDFTGVSSITVNHNIGSEDVLVAVYETTGGGLPQLILPQSVTLTNVNTAVVTFATNVDGYVIITDGKGVASSTPSISASYALTSSHAITASYVLGGGSTNNSYREAVTGTTSYTITHNLNENFPIVQAYEQVSLSQEIPSAIISTGANSVDVIFINNFDGTIVVIK